MYAHDPDATNPNAAHPGANGHAGIDPDAYHQPGEAPGPEGQPGASEGGDAERIPHSLIAKLTARLASAGIKSQDEVERFQREYQQDLEALFGHLDFSDALAEYGITLGGGDTMPAWMRLAGGVGGMGVLLLMRRPELIGRMSAAMRRSDGQRGGADSGESTGSAGDGGHSHGPVLGDSGAGDG